MVYTKKDCGSYKVHLIKTNKFKTIKIKVSFRRPIKKEEITIRNVLCDMLVQSSKKYNNKRALTIKAQDLYAADISAYNSRLGNYINTNFYLTVLHDKYTEEGNYEDAFEFLNEIIFNPDIIDCNFNSEKLDIVKNACRSSINSIKEATGDYSLIRMFEELDSNSPYAYRTIGYLDDLEKITTNDLYNYYQDILKNDEIDIFVIGDIDENKTLDLIKKNIKINTLKKHSVPFLIESKKARSRKKTVKEQIDNSQSKLAIACRCHELTDYERKYPLTIFNLIFGATSDSKLFQNVREKNSLCYTIGSIVNKLDNILIIRAGIDKNSFKKAVDLIGKALQEMKKGAFTENDIKIAKETYDSLLDEIEESQKRIINDYYMMELLKTDSLEEKRKKMKAVTKEEIIKMAQKIQIDTVFCLEGVKNEEN